MQRPGRAQRRRGVRRSPPTTTIQLAPSPKEAKLSESEKGWGSGVFPDYGNPTRSHAEEGETKRSGQAERSGEKKGGRVGVIPRLRQSNSQARRRRPSQAQRLGRAPRRRAIRGPSPAAAVQLARTPKKTMPSAAARPSAAEKGGFGGHPRLRQSNSLARRRKPSRAQRPGRAQRRRGDLGASPDYGNPTSTHAEEGKRSGEGEF